MPKTYVSAMTLQAIDATTLLQTFTPINPAGLPNALFLLVVINTSGVPIALSLDGVTDCDVVTETRTPIPVQQNSQPNAQVALFKKGQVIYARYITTAPTAGDVAIGGYFVPN